MTSPQPYGPEDFVQFSNVPLEYLIHTGVGAGMEPHVALGQLTIPGYNRVADRLEINVGALGGFAVDNKFHVIYVLDNPNDAPTNFERHDVGRNYKLGDRLFESSSEKNVLAIYFNGLTASRVISAHKEKTYSVEEWITHISRQLVLEMGKSIKSRSWSSMRRLARTTFLRSIEITNPRIATIDDLMMKLRQSILDADAEL